MITFPSDRITDSGRRRPPFVITDSTTIFLKGAAWDHTLITYAISAAPGVDPLTLTAVRQAIESWNEAIAASAIPHLRDFRLVPGDSSERADVDIRLSLGEVEMDGTTELVEAADGSLSRAVVTLSGRALGPDVDVGVVATEAVRQLGRALGLGFAATPEDPMYPAFNGVKLRPSEDDVQAFAAVESWYLAGSPVFYPPGAAPAV